MTQEDKQLLLKDLSARLPYGVKVDVSRVEEWRQLTLTPFILANYYNDIEKVKPYLRPMSSMTEEERRYLLEELGFDEDLENGELNDFGSYVYHSVNVLPLFDWLNAHHLDFRGLIPMGLALEAPEDMYKTE